MRDPGFGFVALTGFFAMAGLAAWAVALAKLAGQLPELPFPTAGAIGFTGALAWFAASGYRNRRVWTLRVARLWLACTILLYFWLFLGPGRGIPDYIAIAALPLGSALMGLTFLVDRATRYLFRHVA